MSTIGRRGVLRGAAIAAGAALVSGQAVSSQASQGTGGSQGNGASPIYSDTLSDYGVRLGTDHRIYNGHWTPAFKSNPVPRALIYSATGPRHAHLGPNLGAGLNPPLTQQNVAQRAVIEWGEEFGFEVDWTEDVRQLENPGTLRRYNVLIFLSTSREVLNDPSRTAIRQYMRSGGGFVAIHNTLGAEYNWDYFQGMLGGANFYDHGPNRDATVVTVDRKDVSTIGLPRRWDFRDEWYNLEPLPSPLVRVLLEVDTDTFENDRVAGGTHPGHAGYHPVSWAHYFDGGRCWVTSLGHNSGHWNGELGGSEFFKEHVVNGILGAAGAKPFLLKK